MRNIFVLSMNDLRNIRRDPILFLIIIGPILLTFLFRYSLPIVDKLLYQQFEFRLLQYNDLIMGFVMLLVPFLVGILVGLIIMDEKDENLLIYYAVTPLTKQGYLLYRLSIPFILSFLLSIVMWVLNGYIELNMLKLLPLAMLTALQAPVFALAMSVFATNKVEGLAFAKASGVILCIPFFVYFLSSSWAMIGLVFPTFWVSYAFFYSFESTTMYIFFLIGGLIIHILYIQFLLKKFNKRVF